jgi:hypothetical protein
VGHEGGGLVVVVLGDLEEAGEVVLVDLLLAGQVGGEGLAGEEAVETLAEVDVGLAVEEDEVVVSEELGGDIDDARLDVAGRVEDLAREVAGGSDDNEPGEDVSVIIRRDIGEDIIGGTYLWKTETQLRSPLAHLAWYSWNLGSMDCRKGPMKGSFMAGPTIEPFCMM